MAITSRVRVPLGFAERAIVDWHNAGLLKPSTIKPIIATIVRALVRKVLGRI